MSFSSTVAGVAGAPVGDVVALLGAAGPDLGVHEIAQQDRCDDAERDPLDAVGQERPGVQVGEPDHAEPAGLVVDQLQI